MEEDLEYGRRLGEKADRIQAEIRQDDRGDSHAAEAKAIERSAAALYAVCLVSAQARTSLGERTVDVPWGFLGESRDYYNAVSLAVTERLARKGLHAECLGEHEMGKAFFHVTW